MEGPVLRLVGAKAIVASKVLAAALASSYLFTCTGSIVLNLILFLLAAGAVHLFLYRFTQQHSGHNSRGGHFETHTKENANNKSPPALDPFWGLPTANGAHSRQHQAWRDHVRSPMVEGAWETLCGSIVQEFIYDTWYAFLTPDREFPAEIRRILNHAFGKLAERGRRVDLRAVLEDVSELVMEQLELYRDTREGVQLSTASSTSQGEAELKKMDPVTRDAAFRAQMMRDGNLHPALGLPTGAYTMLRSVSEGIVGLLLDPADSARVATRAVARELLSGCVLRPLLMFCTPYHVNKGLYWLLEQQANRPAPVRQVPGAESARAVAMRGHWEFEQRIMKAAEAETTMDGTESSGGVQRHPSLTQAGTLRQRRHIRSRSQETMSSTTTQVTEPESPRRRSETQVSAKNIVDTEHLKRTRSSVHVSDLSGKLRMEADIGDDLKTTPEVIMAMGEAAGGHKTTGIGRLFSLSASDALQPSNSVTGASPPPRSSGLLVSLLEPLPSVPKTPGRQDTPLEPLQGREESAANSSGEGHFVAPRAAASATEVREYSSASLSGLSSIFRNGFIGLPRARVVAADLKTSGTKDFVMYKIRVGDDSYREWTVSRRYRHFEVLHRQLRGTPGYRGCLPPKRIFIHSHREDFVEERRQSLDIFLQTVLSMTALARSEEVWEFLRVGSERFESPDDQLGGKRGKIKRGISRTVLAATQTVGKGVVGAALDVTQAVTLGIRAGMTGVSEVVNEAVDGLPLKGLRHRRSASVPEGLQDYDASKDGPAGLVSQSSSTIFAQHSSYEASDGDGGQIVGKGEEALRTSESQGFASRPQVSTSTSRWPHKGATATAPTITDRSRRSTIKPSRARNRSPVKARRAESETIPPVALAERSTAFRPGFPPLALTVSAPEWGENDFMAAYQYASMDASGLTEAPMPVLEVDAFGMASPSPMGPRASGDFPPISGFREEQPPQAHVPTPAGTHDLENSAGISAPLYELVDCVFQLQTRGFFRRQVYTMARQVLSVAIGDAIDVYLLAKLRLLRQESTIAKVIQVIQASLWPGGIWFQSTVAYRAAHPENSALKEAMNASPRSAMHARAGAGIRPDQYLEPNCPPPLDAEEVKEAVGELLLRRAPVALVRLVGRGPYNEGIQDLYEMLQSPIFVRQLGYGLLEIIALHLCPELKDLFQRLEQRTGL